MKKALLINVFVLPACLAGEIYVSPQGNDQHSGSAAQPLQSITAAVNQLQTAGGGTVWLNEGIYRPGKTITIPSNSTGSPIAIKAVTGKNVTITGGQLIPTDLFHSLKGTEAMTNFIQDHVKNKIYTASLAGTSLADLFLSRPDFENGETYAMLSWNGHMLQQAQWPNRGYAYHDNVLEEGATTRWLKPDEHPAPFSFEQPSGAVFTVLDEMDFNGLNEELQYSRDMLIQGYLAVDWLFERAPAARFFDKNKAIQLLHHTRYGFDFKSKRLPRRFQVVNALCQLDEPGEWYFDAKEKRLYIWPVQPISPTKPFTVVGGDTLMAANAVDRITIEGIFFENFGSLGVSLSGGNHILVGGCTFRNGIDLGLKISDGMYNRIISCDFYGLNRAFNLFGQAPSDDILNDSSISFNDANADMVKSGYSENRRNLIAEHNEAVNNHIHHCRLRGYGLLAIGGVGATFSHNVMHSLNGGMMYGHNDLTMEFNEFYDVGYEMGDWNVAYCGADKSMFNNQVRYNFFHHMMCTPNAYGISAIRADDGASGLRMFGNMFYKTGDSAIAWSGPHNSIENCVVMKMNKTWHSGQFPYHIRPKKEMLEEDWEKYIQMQKDIAAGKVSSHAKENYIGRLEMVIGKEGWKHNKRWIEKYPEFNKIFVDFKNPDCNPWDQSCGIIRNNYHENATWKVLYNHGRNKTKNFEELKAFLPDSMIVELPHDFDPQKMFIDPDNMDFRIKPNFTPIAGFQPIPFEQIGLQVDAYRKDVPDKAAYRNRVRKKYRGKRSSGGRLDMKQLNTRFPRPAYLSD